MTDYATITHDELEAEIHAAYPGDTDAAQADLDAFVAGLARHTLLDREAASEAEVAAYASAVLDADDGGFFAAAVEARRLFADRFATGDDFDEHGNGGLLIPDAWPIGDASECFDLGALSTGLYEDGAA